VTIAQGRVTVDGRRLPFFAITKAATAALRRELTGAELRTALAIYTVLVEHANDEGLDSFTAERARLAERAGVNPSTLTAYAKKLVQAGVLEVEHRREGSANLPNVWTLVEPPQADDAPSSSQTRRGKATEGVLASDEDPPRATRGPSSPDTPEAVASDEDPSSSQTTPIQEGQEEQEGPPAATRTSAAAPAREGTVPGRLPDDPDDLEPLLTAALRGFTKLWMSAELESWTNEVRDELRRHIDVARATDWDAAGEILADLRRSGRLKARTPKAAARFALRQDKPMQRRPAPTPTPDGPRRRHAGTAPRVDLPPPTDIAAAAWTTLREALPDTVDPAWQTWLDAVHPLRVEGRTLVVTTDPVAASYVASRLVPLLQRTASDQRLGELQFVDPHTAAIGAAA
jgi:hypothetical protein